MPIDQNAARSLADFFRREESAGRPFDPDSAARTAVAHLLALGYQKPSSRQDLTLAPWLRRRHEPRLGVSLDEPVASTF